MISFTVEGFTIEECVNNMRNTLRVLEKRLAREAQNEADTFHAERADIDFLATCFSEQTGRNLEKFLVEHFGESRVQDIPQFLWPEVRRKMKMEMGFGA
jgi:hypothetical protein